jgi:dTDP-4-amino-4,6-dideoxygalactose transaminase
MNPYDNVRELEKRIAEYAGSKYAVGVDSCTNALLLSLVYTKQKYNINLIELPKYTYVGVAYACLNAGLKIKFRDENWKGCYQIIGTNIIDSARRFYKGMYIKDTLYCLSCHWSKHLKIGRGGFICTDDLDAVEFLKKARFDGRTEGVPPREDNFNQFGFHCYQLPEEAARGLMLMASMPDYNDDIPADGYADLSTFPIFTEGYKCN